MGRYIPKISLGLMFKLDLNKLVSNLKSTYKVMVYALSIVIPLMCIKWYFDEIEISLLGVFIFLLYFPILSVKVVFYTFVHDLTLNKYKKAFVWSFLSTNLIIFTVLGISYFQPPVMNVFDFLKYSAIYFIIFFILYFELPIKIKSE